MNCETNLTPVPVERLLLVPKKELCFASQRTKGRNVSGNLSSINTLKSKFLGHNGILSFNGNDYTNHRDTVNDHNWTSLGNINNKVLAVGGSNTDNKKVEMFDINSNTWTTKASFPYCLSG